MSDPRVSILMAAFNAERFIGAAIESVMAQTFEDWELLIVNDGSTDETARIIADFASNDPRIQALSHAGAANRGIASSRNLALRGARGELVAILDADDVWMPPKLADQVAIMDAHPDAGMVCGAVEYWSSWCGGKDEVRLTGFVTDGMAPAPYMAILCYPLGKWNAPTPSDVMIRHWVLAECGGFEEAFVGPYGMYEDQALFAKIYLKTAVFLSSQVWIRYRQHNDSIVKTETKSGNYKIIRRFYLEWFRDYLHCQHKNNNQALLEALRSAILTEENPLIGLVERVRRKIVSSLGARRG